MSQIDVWISSNYTKEKEINKFWKVALRNYVSPNEFLLEYNTYGKPTFKNKRKPYFSVSHTDGIAVLGVSSDGEIGVDLESVARKITNMHRIIDKFFHVDEKLKLEQSQTLERDFMNLWVIKEAFAKMKGLGVVYGLNNFIVNVDKENIFDIREQKLYEYNLIELHNNFVCCIVPKFDTIQFFSF